MNERDSNEGSPPNATFHRQHDGATGDETTGHRDAGEWHRLKQQSSELLEYLLYYLHAKADGVKLSGRKFLFRIERELVALLVIAGALVGAVTLIFIGIAQGLSQLFASQPWLGPLVAGLLLLGCASGGGWWWWRAMEAKSYNETVKKYEQRKQQQQARYGHDVAGRAQADRPTE